MKSCTPFLVLCLVAVVYGRNDLGIEHVYRPKDCSAKAENGDTVFVHYTGSLTDGKKFDSSRDRGVPLDFKLGAGQVIEGWDKGVLGACVGEKRILTIPPHLGYGDVGAPPVIPGGATLKFDIEIMEIKSAAT